MSLLDIFYHVINLFVPAVGLAAIASALAKLFWRQAYAHRPWARLTAWCSASGAVCVMAGLLGFGRDGRMATYGALVLTCAATLAVLAARRSPRTALRSRG